MKTSKQSKRSEFQVKKLIVPGVVMLAFWGVAMWGWLASGYIQPLICSATSARRWRGPGAVWHAAQEA